MRVRPFWALLGLLAAVGCHAPMLQPIGGGGGGGPLPTAPSATTPAVGPILFSPTPAPGGFPVQLPPLSPAPPVTTAPDGVGSSAGTGGTNTNAGGTGAGGGITTGPGGGGGVTTATPAPMSSATPFGQPSNPPLQRIP